MMSMGFRAARYALLLIAGVLLYSIVAPWRATALPELELPDAPKVEAGRPTFAVYTVIGTRNLFQMQAGAAAAAALPLEAPVEETRLPYKLQGAIQGSRPENSTAVIAGGQKGSVVVSVGDEVEKGSGITVAEIASDRVILVNQGRREALNFAEPEFPARAAFQRRGSQEAGKIDFVTPPPRLVAVAARDAERPSAGTQPRAKGATAVVDAQPLAQTTRAERTPPTSSVSNVPEMITAEQAARIARGLGRTEPATIEVRGPVAGAEPIRFVAIAGEPLLRRLLARVALAEGEAVAEVNEIPVSDVARLPELLRSIARIRPSRVKIATDNNADRVIEVELQ